MSQALVLAKGQALFMLTIRQASFISQPFFRLTIIISQALIQARIYQIK